MCKFICFVFLAIASGVTCSPKIEVHLRNYDRKFKTLDNPSFPYDAVDVNPTLGHLAFLIVGANDFAAITKNETIRSGFTDLEEKIRYNHGAHLALIGCDDFGPQDLTIVDEFIKHSGGRKIRTFGYGIFNTNYTISDNRWEDESVDLLLDKFMKTIHGDSYERHEYPNEYVSIFDPNPPAGRLESFRMNTINGRFESKIVVTFILIGGDKMDEFLKTKHQREQLMQIAADAFDPFRLVFLMGCYNFRNHFYLIADVIEQQKTRLVEKHRGPIKADNIRVHVHGRGILSCDFVYINKPIVKLIPNVDIEELDPFLNLYYEKTNDHTEYAVYDCNLNYVKQLKFEYLNGLYKPHATNDSFKFDISSQVIKIIFTTRAQFDSVSANEHKFSGLRQALKDAQPTNHKVYLVVCYAEISTYPNVIVSMLENHLGNYMKKNLGEVWLTTPKTIGPIQRTGDGGRYKALSYKLVDDILENA